MKYIGFVIFCFLFTSCNYFDVKKTSSEEILKEELQSFNWNDVDVFPTFAVCDSSATLQERKQCFENTLTNHVLRHLSKDKLIVSQEINDTIFIDFKLNQTGDISILNTEIDDEVFTIFPNIKVQLESSLDSLPKIYPAIKRGQHVTTQFKLPIIIKAD